jgi:hypothetical protein
MNGDTWLKRQGWETRDKDDPDIGIFFGIFVNANNDVVRISMPRNNVGGSLPASEKFVDILGGLRKLDFESNKIGG